MRAIFGVVSLLVVLAIVGLLATRQLRATGQVAGRRLAGGGWCGERCRGSHAWSNNRSNCSSV